MTIDLAGILAHLAAGGSLTIATYTRATRILQKHVDTWAKAGRPLLKVGPDGHLYMASGKRYVDCCGARLVLA